MKGQSEVEMDQLLEEAQAYLGWELTQVLFDEKALQLHFSTESQYVWLCVSLKPGTPFLFFSRQRIFLIKNLKKPLSLFIKTHLLGEKVQEISRIKESGRVVQIQLSGNKSLEITLVPGRLNILAQTREKSVSAFKPKQLAQQSGPGEAYKGDEVRDGSFFKDLWQKKYTEKAKASAPDIKKEMKKKKSGLKKMLDKLAEQSNTPWQEVGEWLKEHQDLAAIPEDWKTLIDDSKSLAWNIQNCFAQAKKSEDKKVGTLARVEVLRKEITQLESGQTPKKKSQSKPTSLLAQAQLKGRTVELPAGRLFIGRSGTENLKLLRQAKPWYLWFHIKDFPGAYGIIERQKKQGELDQESLQKAAQAVAQASLPKSFQGSCQVIYAECRYVRPIKGAKSGQVTYSHEKVVPCRVGE